MKQLNIIITILTFILFGCEKKVSEAKFEQNVSVDEFEQNVFDEIFIKIVDSTYKDKRLYTCFPEHGKDIYDKNGRWIGVDSIGQKQRDIECDIKRKALRKDTLNLIIAVGNDGLVTDKTELQKYNSHKFTFKHLSELPKVVDYENWGAKYSKFAGAMFFSNIKFDNKKETGTLSVGYACGGNCGLSYTVTIKKVNKKWIVSKVVQTGIS
jgi:hypothetical protein